MQAIVANRLQEDCARMAQECVCLAGKGKCAGGNAVHSTGREMRCQSCAMIPPAIPCLALAFTISHIHISEYLDMSSGKSAKEKREVVSLPSLMSCVS